MSAASSGSQLKTPAASSTTESAAKATSPVETAVLTPRLFFAPNRRETSTAQPAFAPSATAIRIFTIEFEAPMAVSAVGPANLPAIIVSARVYSCWNTALPNSGRIYTSSTLKGLP